MTTVLNPRWSKPTWERAADRTWVLIVPSRLAGERSRDDHAECMYEVFEFDGSWLDQLAEHQVARILKSPRWRAELSSSFATV